MLQVHPNSLQNTEKLQSNAVIFVHNGVLS